MTLMIYLQKLRTKKVTTIFKIIKKKKFSAILHTGKIIDSAASLKLRVGSMSTGYSSDYIIITFQENRIQRNIYRRLSLPPLFLLRHHLRLQIHLLLLTNRDSTKKRNSKNGKRNKKFFTHKRRIIRIYHYFSS